MSEYCCDIHAAAGGARHTLGPPAAPAERHVDGSHGPGWDRDTISAIADVGCVGADHRAQVRALLADRDALNDALGNEVEISLRLEHERDDAIGDAQAHRAVRRAARAIMQKKIDELTAERDQARQFAATDRRALLDTLALVKADRDRLAADIGVHRRTIDGCHERIAELERVRDLHAERAARLSDDLATARRAAIGLAAGLEAARRVGAADALDWAAIQVADWYANPSRASQLMRYAAEVRAGTRTIPPADRSSDE